MAERSGVSGEIGHALLALQLQLFEHWHCQATAAFGPLAQLSLSYTSHPWLPSLASVSSFSPRLIALAPRPAFGSSMPVASLCAPVAWCQPRPPGCAASSCSGSSGANAHSGSAEGPRGRSFGGCTWPGCCSSRRDSPATSRGPLDHHSPLIAGSRGRTRLSSALPGQVPPWPR